MTTSAKDVNENLSELPDDRREAILAVVDVVRKNIDKGFVEQMQYNAVGYAVPHSIYPHGYHCDPKQPLPYLGVASQKNYMSLYMFCLYVDNEHTQWFVDAYVKAGKKLDMGKSCIRFKSLDDLALDVIGEAIRRVPLDRFIAHYEASLPESVLKKREAAAKKSK